MTKLTDRNVITFKSKLGNISVISVSAVFTQLPFYLRVSVGGQRPILLSAATHFSYLGCFFFILHSPQAVTNTTSCAAERAAEQGTNGRRRALGAKSTTSFNLKQPCDRHTPRNWDQNCAGGWTWNIGQWFHSEATIRSWRPVRTTHWSL